MSIRRALQPSQDDPPIWPDRSYYPPSRAPLSRFGDDGMTRLIQCAKAGDAAALEELADQLHPVALRWSLRLLRNSADAEDAAQDALLRWFATLERFESGRPPWPWLRRIVTNSAIDVLRRRGRREAPWSSLARDGEEDAFEPVDKGCESAEERMDRRRTERLVRAAVCDLPPHHRLVIELREFEGLSYREIADRAAIPLGTVMSRLHAARRRLAELVTLRRRSAEREADLRRLGRASARREVSAGRSAAGEEEPLAVPA